MSGSATLKILKHCSKTLSCFLIHDPPAERADALDESVSQEPVAVVAVELVYTVLTGHARPVQVPEDLLRYLNQQANVAQPRKFVLTTIKMFSIRLIIEPMTRQMLIMS